jgi:hypothetical protein
MIDYSIYSAFWYVPSITQASAEIFASTSETMYEPFAGVDIYDNNGGSLVCLKNDEILNGVHNLRISGNGGVFHVQYQTYEDSLDIIEGRPDWMSDITSLFLYLDSVNVSDSTALFAPSFGVLGDVSKRCDAERFGPDAFFEIKPDIKSIVGLRIFMSITGTAHILIIDTRELGSNSRLNKEKIITTESYSITGAVKNILEWNEASLEPWNNTEKPAIIAKTFLESLGFSETTLSDVWEIENPTYMGRFMFGEQDYSNETIESGILPVSLKNDITSTFRYKTLSALVKHHPAPPLIEEDFLTQEKTQIDSAVYSFLVNNGVNIESFTPRSLRDGVRYGFSELKPTQQDVENIERFVGYAHN